MSNLIDRMMLAFSILLGERDELVEEHVKFRELNNVSRVFVIRKKLTNKLKKELVKKTNVWGLNIRKDPSCLLNEHEYNDKLIRLWNEIDLEDKEVVMPLSERKRWANYLIEEAVNQWENGTNIEKTQKIADACLLWHKSLGLNMSFHLAKELNWLVSKALWQEECVNWIDKMQVELGNEFDVYSNDAIGFAISIHRGLVVGVVSSIKENNEVLPWHQKFLEISGKWRVPRNPLEEGVILKAKSDFLKSVDKSKFSTISDWNWASIVVLRLESEQRVQEVESKYLVITERLRADWEGEDITQSLEDNSLAILEASGKIVHRL